MRLPFIPRSIAGVPSSKGFLVTAPPSVCVPAVIGALAVWIQNQKKKCSFRGFTSLPTQEVENSFSGFIPTNKQQTNGALRVSGWLGDLGYMRGDRRREERRTQEWILAEG